MSDYSVRFAEPQQRASLLFETVVYAVDCPQDARLVALARWIKNGSKSSSAWIEVFELPDEVVVLRMPAAGIAPALT